jgi:CubicO group peptidase (beta-lactamase class C family)
VPSPLELIDSWNRLSAAAVLVGGEIVDDRGDVEEPLPWASVTKIATALATLLAVAGGRIGLDDSAGPPGATVRHLLAHASGLAFDSRTIRAAPGERRIYSNAGYEVLADAVAAAVGEPFESWLTAAVLAPLGMSHTRLSGGSPASGLVGPLADLVGLVGELQRPWLLAPPLAQAMRTVAFPGLSGLLPGVGHQPHNDWGLGPEIRDAKAPHWTGPGNDPATFGHFGAAGGFLWVDPAAGVACACLSATPFGPWALAAWPRLADAVLSAWSA